MKNSLLTMMLKPFLKVKFILASLLLIGGLTTAVERHLNSCRQAQINGMAELSWASELINYPLEYLMLVEVGKISSLGS